MGLRYERNGSNFDRAVGFFDAVYGFALTLLVTTIDITAQSSWRSVNSLITTNGSQLLSFLISFIVIVGFWRRNHALVARFTALDSATVTANIVIIGLIIFLPFTTEAMGDPALQDLPLPTALYAFNVGIAVLASIVLHRLALRRGLVEDEDPAPARRAQLMDSLLVPLVMFASVPVTYLGVAVWGDSSAGKYFWLSLLVLGPISGHYADRTTRRARAKGSAVEG